MLIPQAQCWMLSDPGVDWIPLGFIVHPRSQSGKGAARMRQLGNILRGSSLSLRKDKVVGLEEIVAWADRASLRTYYSAEP